MFELPYLDYGGEGVEHSAGGPPPHHGARAQQARGLLHRATPHMEDLQARGLLVVLQSQRQLGVTLLQRACPGGRVLDGSLLGRVSHGAELLLHLPHTLWPLALHAHSANMANYCQDSLDKLCQLCTDLCV